MSEDHVRTSAYFTFRGDPRALRERMPPTLSFLARKLGALDTGMSAPRPGIAAADLAVTPAELEAVLAWGRGTEATGRTLLRSVYVEDHHERSDLDGQGIVELVKPIRVEAPPIRNLAAAYALTWTCARCDRVRAQQVADLEVDLEEAAEAVPGFPGHPDVLFTQGRSLLVGARWRPLLARNGVETRPLSGTRAYLQAIAPERVALEVNRPPLQPGERCPGCGVTAVDRTSTVEGDPPATDEAGLWVSRERPLSIAAPAGMGAPLAVSTRPIDELVEIHAEPAHRPGERVAPELAEALLGARGWNVPFVSEALLAALWDAGATGLQFRPVVQVR